MYSQIFFSPGALFVIVPFLPGCHRKDVHDVLGWIAWKTASHPLPSSGLVGDHVVFNQPCGEHAQRR